MVLIVPSDFQNVELVPHVIFILKYAAFFIVIAIVSKNINFKINKTLSLSNKNSDSKI